MECIGQNFEGDFASRYYLKSAVFLVEACLCARVAGLYLLAKIYKRLVQRARGFTVFSGCSL